MRVLPIPLPQMNFYAKARKFYIGQLDRWRW